MGILSKTKKYHSNLNRETLLETAGNIRPKRISVSFFNGNIYHGQTKGRRAFGIQGVSRRMGLPRFKCIGNYNDENLITVTYSEHKLIPILCLILWGGLTVLVLLETKFSFNGVSRELSFGGKLIFECVMTFAAFIFYFVFSRIHYLMGIAFVEKNLKLKPAQ